MTVNQPRLVFTAGILVKDPGVVKNPSMSIEKRIMEILGSRDSGATMCPSESLPAKERTDKRAMEKVREVARRMVAEGLIDILQQGEVVDPASVKGPIRLRFRREG